MFLNEQYFWNVSLLWWEVREFLLNWYRQLCAYFLLPNNSCSSQLRNFPLATDREWDTIWWFEWKSVMYQRKAVVICLPRLSEGNVNVSQSRWGLDWIRTLLTNPIQTFYRCIWSLRLVPSHLPVTFYKLQRWLIWNKWEDNYVGSTVNS